MRTEKRRRGDVGEEIACQFLARKGYAVVERNYQKPWGEIDIIAIKGREVRFIEVKTVTREISGAGDELEYRPEEMVTREKLKKVVRTASLYMEQNKDEREYQVDVVGVIMDPQKRVARCRLFEQVIE